MKSVVIIGSGNVAEALAAAISATPYQLTQIWARNPLRGTALAQRHGCNYSHEREELATADIYLIAVSDSQIAALCAGFDFGSGVVAHTAGSLPYTVLPTDTGKRGVFYPLQTFTAGRPVAFHLIPLLIEGESDEATQTLLSLGHSLSSNVMKTEQTQRSQLHLAAVFACNFTNHLYAIAQELLSSQGLSPSLLDALIRETTDKAIEASSAATVQTGPACRGDQTTQHRHLELLREKPDLQNIYRLISQRIWEISKKI